MLRSVAGAQPARSDRLLSSELLARLRSRRLPSYSWLATWLRDWRDVAHIAGLWQELFDEPAPVQTAQGTPTPLAGVPGVVPGAPEEWLGHKFTLECEFAGEVHHELFPLDLESYDQLAYGLGEEFSLLEGPVLIEGRGIAWEWEHFDSGVVPKPAMPLGAFVIPHLSASHEPAEPESHYEEIARWWTGGPDWVEVPHDGYAGPAYPGWDALPADLEQRLSALPAPLDGLAGYYRTLRKDCGNPFLAHSTYLLWDNYEYYSMYDWTAENLRDLAEWYEQTRPIVTKMDAYDRWFYETEDAIHRVVEILQTLEE